METVEFALRDEITNVFALTYGHLPLEYSHQIMLCKKDIFTKRYSGPFLLVPKVTKGNYNPSNVGINYLETITSLDYEYKYVAYLDSYIRVPILPYVFETPANEGFFSVWLPSEPLKYFESRTQGYLALLRVFEIAEDISPAYLSRGIKGRNFYFRLDEEVNVIIKGPVLEDHSFNETKLSLINSLRATGQSISMLDESGLEI